MSNKKRNVDSLKQFCGKLHRTGLMNEETIQSVWKSIETKKPRDAEELSQELIKRNHLTQYQVERLKNDEAERLKIGQYTIVDRIGAGGMGEVLKARHTRMHRDVAIKIISEKVLDTPDALDRFAQESRMAAQLSHPNIVTAYDAGEAEGTHYLVLEYVDGQDLHSILGRKGPLRLPIAIDYMIQAAEGLQYAHRKNVVHRDIKPANLLVDATGVVKILDMGLAFMAQRADVDSETSNQRLTQQGQIMGTTAYMAPEQAVDVRKADARSDIYSLGCTLYDVLVGRPPYSGETHMAVIVAHREEPIPSIRAERSDCPASVDEVFRKMVAKQPEDRYASMSEVIEALRCCTMRRSEPVPVESSGSMATQSLPPVATPPAKPPVALVSEFAINTDSPTDRASQETATFIAAKQDTVVSRRKRKPTKRPNMAIVIGAVCLAVLALGGGALAVVLSLSTPKGTLVVETNDPNVKVAVMQGGEYVEIVDANDDWKVNLKEGKYELELTGGDDQFKLDQHSVVVTRGETERLRVTFKPKPAAPAVAEVRFPAVPMPNEIVQQPIPLEPAPQPPTPSPPVVQPPAPQPPAPQPPVAQPPEKQTPAPRPPAQVAPPQTNTPPQVAANKRTPLEPSRRGVPAAEGVVIDSIPDLEQVHRLQGMRRSASHVEFTADGKQLIAGSDGMLTVWNVENGKLLMDMKHGIYRPEFALSPDGLHVAVVGDYAQGGIYLLSRGIKVHDLSFMSKAEAEEVTRETRHVPMLNGVAYSPDGSKLVTGTGTGEIYVWDTVSGDQLANVKEHKANIYGAAFAPDGHHFATVSYDGTTRVWNSVTFQLVHTLKHGAESTTFDLVFSHDSKTLYTVGNATDLVAWNVASGEKVKLWKGHGAPVICVSLSSDEKMFASIGSGDHSLRFWNADNSTPLSVWRNPEFDHRFVRFSPTDPTLFVTTTRGPNVNVTLWRYKGEALDDAGSVTTEEDGTLVIRQEVADDHLIAPPWQSFTAPQAGKLIRVEFQPVMKEGAESDLSIYAGAGTDGERLHTQKVVIRRTDQSDWRSFKLSEPVVLEEGKIYTVELAAAIGMMHSKADRYADGNGSRRWARDMAFRFHIQPAE